MTDELISDHAWQSNEGLRCTYLLPLGSVCDQWPSMHVLPLRDISSHLVSKYPHAFLDDRSGHCAFKVVDRVCGYPQSEHRVERDTSAVVRLADVAQYPREPMPDRGRGGISVTLIDAPVDPLGTLAVICGMYEGRVYRSKAEVDDDARRNAWEAMGKTVLSGPLEAMQLTFLIEGCDRALTHQIVRNRFSFFAQESLRFAVPEDWAQEVALPPSLAGLPEDSPLVTLWRRGLNGAEDLYASLVAAGMPAEEARGVLPHAIPTRLFWTLSVRTLIMEAGKRTCTQAQFPWRLLMAGVAKALRERAVQDVEAVDRNGDLDSFVNTDGWQYELFAAAIQPVCYQTGRCGFKAEFDRACSIRGRVDDFESEGIPSRSWGFPYHIGERTLLPISPSEWLADPAAARVTS